MSRERAERFDELIKKELGKIISDFLDLKSGVLATITRVATASNLFTASIFVSVYPPSETEKVLENLNRSIFKIQQELNKKMKTRPVPKINFKRDRNPEAAGEVEKILEEIKNEKP